MKRFVLLLSFLLAGLNTRAQNTNAVLQYIDRYKELAITEMIRTGVPAAITLAQGIHESGAGNSELAISGNNHFGIKCKSNWTGEFIRHDDDARQECFRKYKSPEESYRDHSDFLKNGTRYAFLFSLDPADYTSWANGLKQAGYATNPKYPQVLVKLIEDYNLQQYSLSGLARMSDSSARPPADAQIIPVKVSETIVEPVKPVYPEGVFILNETKVVFVKKGTSFLALAKKYDVDLSKLFDFNDMTPAEQTEKDQLLFLQRKRKTGANEFHLVQPGENMLDIAQAEAIRLESLLKLNLINDGEMAAVGEKLHLQTQSTRLPRLAVKGNYSLVPAKQPK